jgi:hypothetical protein
MNKEELLELLQLLSALESWSFSTKSNLPDYLLEAISEKVDRLKEELLKP